MRHVVTVSIERTPPELGTPKSVALDNQVGEGLNYDHRGSYMGNGGVSTRLI